MSWNRVERRVVYIASATRILVLTLGIIADLLVRDYDRSGLPSHSSMASSASKGFISSMFSGVLAFTRWDSVFMLDISQHGYRFEQQYAFQPFLPFAIHILSNSGQRQYIRSCIFDLGFLTYIGTSVLLPMQWILPQEIVSVIAGLLICNVSFVVAALLLYRLGFVILRDESLAYRAAIIFCFTPASVFMSAIYTESLFAMLSFHGWLLLHYQHRIFAAIAFALATSTRSNGIVLVGFFLFEALHSTVADALSFLQRCRRLAFVWVRALICCLIVVWPNILIQYWAYDRFCLGNVHPSRPFCQDRIPNVYAFVQKQYWNVGFLRYYTFKQLPNFLLASPIISLAISAIWRYSSACWTDVLTAGLVRKSPRRTTGFECSNGLCYVYHLAILVVMLLLFVHVQIATRFLSGCPSLYWYVATLCSGKNARRNASIILSYSLVYAVLGTSMFVNFYPWT